MKVGVPKETRPAERRVAMVPDVVKRLVAAGHEVVMEPGAGAEARIPDAAYTSAGATLDAAGAWGAEIVAKVAAPTPEEIGRLARGQVLVGFLAPLTDTETAKGLAGAGVTALAMEAIPRISRAQAMDALSSQATVAGYRAVLMATEHFGRFLPMLMTAAGTIPPAQVLVLGAGVAGLQAIATARRLGAVVTGFDVRAATREQVESLGARWLDAGAPADGEGAGGYARELTEAEQEAQRAALADAVAKADVVITTAAVPGRPAPRLVTTAAVERMRPGSVIVDLAGEGGGNAEPSKPGEIVVHAGVTLACPLGIGSQMPEHASQLYARNVQSLLELLAGEGGALHLDFDDEIVAGSCLTRDGEIVHPAARSAAGLPEQEG